MATGEGKALFMRTMSRIKRDIRVEESTALKQRKIDCFLKKYETTFNDWPELHSMITL